MREGSLGPKPHGKEDKRESHKRWSTESKSKKKAFEIEIEFLLVCDFGFGEDSWLHLAIYRYP